MGTLDRNAQLDQEINADVLHMASDKMEESGLVKWSFAWSTTYSLGLWSLGQLPGNIRQTIRHLVVIDLLDAEQLQEEEEKEPKCHRKVC